MAFPNDQQQLWLDQTDIGAHFNPTFSRNRMVQVGMMKAWHSCFREFFQDCPYHIE